MIFLWVTVIYNHIWHIIVLCRLYCNHTVCSQLSQSLCEDDGYTSFKCSAHNLAFSFRYIVQLYFLVSDIILLFYKVFQMCDSDSLTYLGN